MTSIAEKASPVKPLEPPKAAAAATATSPAAPAAGSQQVAPAAARDGIKPAAGKVSSLGLPTAGAATPTFDPYQPLVPPGSEAFRIDGLPPATITNQPTSNTPVGDYSASFGGASYVKDSGDHTMVGLMQRAVQQFPELAGGPLGQGVQAGQCNKEQVKALQGFLRSKGYDVGHTGVDGKYGPNTHGALAALLNGQPPAAPQPGNGPAPASVDNVKPATPPPSISQAPAGAEPFTAVYDVSTHTVYLPDGTKLEAHSGLGANRDNPSSSHIRNAGSTPAATYKLSMREARYHGVEALRLTPIGGTGNTYGRSGILAHTYMVGKRGDSHGCVVFRDYPAFLKAYKSGQIKQIKVVAHL